MLCLLQFGLIAHKSLVWFGFSLHLLFCDYRNFNYYYFPRCLLACRHGKAQHLRDVLCRRKPDHPQAQRSGTLVHGQQRSEHQRVPVLHHVRCRSAPRYVVRGYGFVHVLAVCACFGGASTLMDCCGIASRLCSCEGVNKQDLDR